MSQQQFKGAKLDHELIDERIRLLEKMDRKTKPSSYAQIVTPPPPPTAVKSVDKPEEYYVLYCYMPPNIHSKNFTPFRTGVIGIFSSMEKAAERRNQIYRENTFEYRGFQLFIGFSKLIETDLDYAWPLGYNEAF